MYGIVTAKVSNQDEEDPYGWKSYAILLPWVSHCTLASTVRAECWACYKSSSVSSCDVRLSQTAA